MYWSSVDNEDEGGESPDDEEDKEDMVDEGDNKDKDNDDEVITLVGIRAEACGWGTLPFSTIPSVVDMNFFFCCFFFWWNQVV